MSIYDSENDRIRGGRVVAYLVALIVVLVAVGWGARLWDAHTSGAKGTLQIQQQRGTAANRTQWAATFTGLYHQIQADQQNIQIAQQAAAGPHATVQDATNLTGVQMTCRNDVAEYDGDLGNALAVVPDGYPSVSIDAASACASNTTGLQTP